jgi:hypothetical protein
VAADAFHVKRFRGRRRRFAPTTYATAGTRPFRR